MTCTVYACTHVEKTVVVDDFKEGCDPKGYHCVLSERVNLTAETLPGLIDAIRKHYGVEMDDLWIPDDEDDGQITRIGFNCLEDADGNVPSLLTVQKWKDGVATLYLADYSFCIEKRVVSGVPLAEFAQAGIRYHE